MQPLAKQPQTFSRRGFFATLTALLALLTSKVRGSSLRRRKGARAATGWFGHC